MILGGSFFTVSSYIWENKFYPVYRNLYDYRRLTPEIFPSSFTLKLLSVGHFTTYANIMWVELIQFVGDNIWNNLYLDFSHKILGNITDLSPYFDEAYELDLLFTPLVYADYKDDTTADEYQKIERAIQHGKEWMKLLCDEEKIAKISEISYGNVLWSRTDLINPCKNGMIPYYIAYHYSNDLGMNEDASYYYKIASMQTDTPDAAKFLGPLAFANTKDPLNAASSLLFISREWYDKEPYACQKYADLLLGYISGWQPLNEEFIKSIETFEYSMPDIKDEKVLEAYSATNCPDNLRRAIKQIYLAYITQKAKDFPDIEDGKVLLEQWIISTIPTISTQSGYNVRKIEGRWNYRSY